MSADYPFPGYHQQQNNLPKAKKLFPRLAAVPSQVLQTNIRRLHDAWDFFQKRGYGFPRYKKYGQMKSILFPQFKTSPLTPRTSGGTKGGIWQISLPKLEKVQINLHRPIPEGFAVKQQRIVKKAVGWFAIVSISSDVEIPQPLPHGHFIGVDIGLLNYLATSARSNCFSPLNGGKACERFRRTKAQIFQNRASSAESATTQTLEENEAF